MTYGQFLETCEDEFEKTVIIANLARRHPNYDSYSRRRKAETLKELLDAEMPRAEREDKDDLDRDGV